MACSVCRQRMDCPSYIFHANAVFFSQNLNLSSIVVFGVFIMNAVGGCFGYYYKRRKAQTELSEERRTVMNIALIRRLPAFSLTVAILHLSALTTALAVAMLILMGFAYAVFLINTLSISMEVLPQGKAGLFNVLVGVGGAVGCLTGPLIANMYGFLYVFLTASAIFLPSHLAFRISASGQPTFDQCIRSVLPFQAV